MPFGNWCLITGYVTGYVIKLKAKCRCEGPRDSVVVTFTDVSDLQVIGCKGT